MYPNEDEKIQIHLEWHCFNEDTSMQPQRQITPL